jgi:ribosomal protein S18 acetylase RimI-like enzyme
MALVAIAQADLADVPAILELQRRAYQSEAVLYNDWSIPPLTQTLGQLREEFLSSVVLKAVVGQSLIGSVRARLENAVVRIGRLIVEPSAQRQGTGSSLLREIESAFPTANCFELFTGSLSEGNLRLYRRHGYAVTHEKVLSPGVTLVYLSKTRATVA